MGVSESLPAQDIQCGAMDRLTQKTWVAIPIQSWKLTGGVEMLKPLLKYLILKALLGWL